MSPLASRSARWGLNSTSVQKCLETGETKIFFEHGKCPETGETTKPFEYGKCLETGKPTKSLEHFRYSRDFVVFPVSRHSLY